MSAATREPVTVGGWYEEEDGTVAEYRWAAGRLVRGRAVASWADVPESPTWDDAGYRRPAVEVQS